MTEQIKTSYYKYQTAKEMSFIHVNNHPHAKTLFVACCKMSNKHLIARYHHDKQNIIL